MTSREQQDRKQDHNPVESWDIREKRAVGRRSAEPLVRGWRQCATVPSFGIFQLLSTRLRAIVVLGFVAQSETDDEQDSAQQGGRK